MYRCWTLLCDTQIIMTVSIVPSGWLIYLCKKKNNSTPIEKTRPQNQDRNQLESIKKPTKSSRGQIQRGSNLNLKWLVLFLILANLKSGTQKLGALYQKSSTLFFWIKVENYTPTNRVIELHTIKIERLFIRKYTVQCCLKLQNV